MKVNIGKLVLQNPVMTASGTFGYGEEYKDFVDLNKLGAIVVKGTSLNPSQGNPTPRIVETAAGMLNAIGLQNIGVDEFIKTKLPCLCKYKARTIVNIYAHSINEFKKLTSRLNDAKGVHALEINVSCPNVKKGGMAFGVYPDTTYKVVKAVKEETDLPIITKLSPNVTDIAEIAKAAEEAGSDAVSLINTLLGMAIDINTRRPKLKNITGGLSGPAIKPVAIRMVWQVYKKVNIPIIGMGGIMSTEDALEFIIAGASAIAVGTGNFVKPRLTMEILEGIKKYLKEKKIKDIKELVGSLDISNNKN
ncbi:MAG: dihydroorotate dehydrogenase [Candidatus Firestonebacteria bacterium]|nr:dihydroorotate dehydrogenase [Candidatus Firestonebacteria bacterium]